MTVSVVNSLAKTLDESSAASRREFIKGSSMLLAGGAIPGSLPLPSGGSTTSESPIRVALVGCGMRGTAIAIQALNPAHGEVRLIAVADVFEDRVQQAMRALRSGPNRDRVEVDPQHRFVGLDAYRKVMETNADLVILAAPPGFRPLHFEAAVSAGKHVFAEKPVAVDAEGVRQFLQSCQTAADRKLAVAVGLQRRHEPAYQATIAQLQSGAIGRINFCRAFWNQGASYSRPRAKQQTELEYQLRNWNYFNWLSGDHIVEQHVHNLDVINWLLNSHPERAQGMGGRQVRTGSEFGQVYDHHAVEFGYRGGVKLLSMCRQMPGCWNSVGEFAHGTEGWADIAAGKVFDLEDRLVWEAEPSRLGHAGELAALFNALRSGRVPREGEYAAESTLTAIMGRTATYTGKEVTWTRCLNQAASSADVATLRTLRDLSPCLPDNAGRYRVSQPGDTGTALS